MFSKIVLEGRTIDLGGHKDSSYVHLIQTKQPIEIANYDDVQTGTHKVSSGADHTFDFEKPFPLPDSSFDNVICANVLEHIFNHKNLIAETYRILKRGGRFYISVPFFFNIHASPNDYFRYTRVALERLLSEAGFDEITIAELGDGPCSAIFQNFGGSIPTICLKQCFKHIAIGTDTFFSRFSSKYRTIRCRVPLGYFVIARKQ